MSKLKAAADQEMESFLQKSEVSLNCEATLWDIYRILMFIILNKDSDINLHYPETFLLI